MANEEKNVNRYFEVYEAMKQAVPDDNNMLEVMRACEFIIADCIAQSNVGKEVEEQTYKAIADDIRKFTDAFKPIAEEVTRRTTYKNRNRLQRSLCRLSH